MSDTSGSEGNEFREKFESTMDENRSLRQQLALTQAGIDTSTPMGKMFAANLAHREGDLEVEALKVEWAELGGATPVVAPTEPVPGTAEVPGVSQEALESLRLQSQVGGTAPPAQDQDQTAQEAAWAAMETSRVNGEAKAMQNAAFFGTLMSRASQGDPSAQWTQEGWNQHLMDNGQVVQ